MTYTQTGCSFPRNFADFRRDIGNLIGSLLRAICNWRDQFATELVEVAAPIHRQRCFRFLVNTLAADMRAFMLIKQSMIITSYSRGSQR